MTLRDIAKAIRMTGARTERQEPGRTRRRSGAAPRVASGLSADLLVLEPRILFDGAGIAVAAQTVDHAEAQAVQEAAAVAQEADQTAHPVGDVEANAGEEQSPAAVTTEPLASEPAAAGREIVFIDPLVEDYHTLLAGIEPRAEVVLLNADRDGLEQIAEVLAGRTDINAIHIISHGTQAELTLGTAHLTLESMNGAYADELAVIGQSLSEKADLLIYGCNFGQGESGAEAATRLGQLTGADVSASMDDTGHTSLGGDWDLEFATGLIETHTVVCQPVLEKWFGLLDLTSLQATQDTYIMLKSPDTTNNFGASTSMVVDRESTDLQRALLQFDLSSIPAGSTINSATLRLQSTQIGGTLNIGVYEVTQAWSEGTGNGTAGAANWNERQTGTNWTTSGGTFNSTAVATINTNATGQHNWNVTLLVQAWFNGTNVNNGLMVASPDGGGNRTVTYDSSEGTTVPVLEINYTPPSNTAPVITNLSGDSLAYAEGDGAVVIEQGGNATVTDVDSVDFSTGMLTVSFTAGSDSAEDVLAIRNQGTGAGQIGVSGSNVTYQGVTIGTFAGGSGGSNLVITMNSSATPTAAQALLRNVTYQDTDTNAPTTGARTVRFVLTDGDGGTSANHDTTVTVSGVNDAPTITNLSGDSLAYNEGDGAVVIEQGGNATVSDVDSTDFNTGTLTVSFTAGSDSAEDVLAIRNQGTGAGQIGVSGSNVTYQGVTIGTFAGGSGGSNLVITMNSSATPTAAQALLRNVTYQDTDTNAPTTGARTVRFVLTDGDGGSSANHDTTVTVSGVNDAPTITNLSGDSLAYNEGDGAVVIEQGGNATVSDVDSTDFNTGTLTVSFTAGSDSAEDVLAIRNQGTGAGQIGVSGSNVTYQGVTIGTFAGGSGGSNLVITMNSSATPTAAQALLRNVTYQDTDTNAPTTGARTVRFVLTDGDGGTSANHDTTVTVSGVNDAPTITNLSGDSLAYAEGDGAVVIEQGGNATVTDVDSVDFSTGMLTVSFTAGSDSAEDVLAIRNQGTGAGQIGVSGANVTYQGVTIGTFTGGSGGTNLVITLNSSATPTAVTAQVKNITYQDTDTNAPTTGARTVRYVLTDGDGGTSANYDTTVTVSGVNDPPVNTVPGAQTTPQNTSLVFSAANGNAISLSDVDAGSNPLQVILTATNGTLTLNGTAGLGFSTGDGNADATMTFTGTAANINTALNGLSFAPTAGFTGSATVQITSNDQGNAGSGGALIDTDVVNISVASSSLWLSSNTTATSSPGSGGLSWNDGQVVNFGNPNLDLGTGTTGGTFTPVFDIDSFAASNANVTGLHYVSHTVVIGSGANSVTLQAGDVLLAVDANEILGGVAVTKNDIVLFRPTTPGNFSSGTFSILLQNPTNKQLGDFALVEQSVVVGGTTLSAGGFLLTEPSKNDVDLFVPTDAGVGTTSGSLTAQFIDGAGITLNPGVNGIELIHSNMTLGGASLTAGQLLLSINANDATIGSPVFSASTYDIFVLTLSSTGVGTTAGTASQLFVGADVGISAGGEEFDAIALYNTASTAPVLTLPGSALNYTENDAATVIDATATITDSDSPNFSGGTLIVDFSANGNVDDQLAVRNEGTGAGQIGVFGSNVTYGGVTIGTWTGGTDGSIPLVISFNTSATPTAVQALVRNITFQNVSDAPSTLARTVRFQVTDGDGGTSVPVSETITVAAQNDAPTITNLAGDSLSYSEGDGAVVIEQGGNATVSDVDSTDFNTGTLTVSFTAGSDSAEDVLAIRNQGTGAGQIGVSGANVTYSGITIGSFAGGSAGANLVITFTGLSSPAAAQALIRNITFQDTDTNAPTTGARTVRFVLTDGDGGTSANHDTTVTVSGVNDAPTITNLSGDSLAYAEGDGAVVIEQGGNATVTDVDSVDFSTGMLTVSFTAGSDSAEDVLAIRNQGTGAGQIGVSGANVTYSGITIGSFAGGSAGANLVITFTGLSSPAAAQALIRNITFQDTDINAPTTGARTVRFVLTDGDGGTSANHDTTVTVSGVNDAPTATITPATYAATEQVALTLHGTGLAITDVDAGGGAVQATVSVTSGVLTAAAGTTGVTVTGSGTATVTLDGTLTQINNLLAGNLSGTLTYTANSDTPPASATLTLTASDLGNTGSGGTLTGNDTATINITAVNDAPIITSDGGAATAAVTAVENQTAVTTVTSSDVDGGVPVYSISGGADQALFTINAATGLLTFNAAPNFEAPADAGANNVYDVLVQVSDGNGGNDTQALAITVTNVNEAPIITSDGGAATAAVTAAENQTAVTTVTSSDVDGGVPVYSISGGADQALFTINAATGFLTFNAAPNFEAPADAGANNVYDVIVQVSDGNGGTDTQALAITVTDNADGIRVTPISVVPIGGELRVTTTTTDMQTINPNVAQAVATDAAGNFVVVWASNLQDGSAYGIYAQRYSADGVVLGSEFLVNTITADNQINPGVAMDDAGNFVVTWMSNLQDGSGYGIYAQRFNAGGVAQGGELLVNTTTAASQTTPAIAISPTGAFVITWTGGGQDPDASSGIYAQRFDASGVAQGGEFRVNTYTTNTQQLTSVGTDGAGNFVITWASLNQDDGASYGVYGQRFDASGVAQGAEFRVNTTIVNSQLYHDVAMLPDGRFVVAFQSRNADGSFEVFLQRYAADGSTLGGETRVNTSTVSSAQQPIPSITADSSGNITVVWNSAADGSGVGVVGRRLDWSGTPLGGEFQVNTTTAGNQLYAEVVAQPGGGFIVAWGGNGPGDADGVFLQRYGLTTTEAGGPATFSVVLEAAPTADVVIPISVPDGTEGTVAVGSLTFTNANWNIAQTVTVTGVQDYANDGNVVYTAVLGTATSTDLNFNGLNPTDLSVTNFEVPNVAPVNTVPGAQSVNEDTALVFSSGNGNAITISDADAGTNALQVTLSVTNGVLTLGGVAGLSFSSGANGSPTMTFTGTIASINTALNGLRFDPTGNFIGSALLTLVTNDQGNTGTGSAQSDNDTVAITVNPVNDAPIGGPTITGTVTEDQTLTANTAGISDADGLGAFSYQWLRNNVVVGGATASTYLLGDADVGAQMSVRVTYTDSQGTAEGPLTSAPTAAVANVNDAPIGGPTITGTVTEDQTLTANTAGISDADGLGAFSYQWLRNNVAVGGATASTYLLGDADVGAQMSVRVTYTDSQGTAEGPLTSAPTAAVANVNDAPIGGPTITGTVTEDQTLTANTAGISDADGLGAFSYQWLRNGVAVGGATASTYLLGDADVGAQMSVRVTYTDSQGTAEGPLTSAPTAAVANVNDAPIGGPTITGTVTEDQTLTANTAGISDADGLGAFSYQWLRNNVVVGGATASTYLLGDADVGAQMSVRVTYTDSQGTAEGPLTSAPTAAVANVNDAPIGGPTITGTVTEDQTLTANTAGISDADGLGAFSYQWLRNNVAVGGATASTYLLGDADVGAQMSVRVTYTDSQGTAEGPLTSAPTAAVANVNDAPIGGPTITGTVTEDQTLTANTAGISDADGLGAFSYQWLRNNVAVGGATASTYLLGDADVGAQMSVRVTYTDSQGTAEGPLTSAPTAAVANVNDAPIGGPTITGTVTEDQTLTANTAGISDADGLGAFSYQWLRNNVAVGGATASTYLLGDADVGAQMSVRVTYTDSQGTAEGPLTSAPTAAVANVNDAPIGGPTITGTVTEDQTLTANTAGISDADGLGAFSYQWLRNNVAVGGATASTYLLGDADVGAQMSVRVTYTDSQGTAEGPLTSAPTAAVANVNDAPIGGPTITGTVTEDQTLTANTAGISDADGLGAFSYQWLRNNVAVGGATASTYLLGDADVGAQMSVRVTYTDSQGTAEGPLTSAPTAAVANVNDAPIGGPTITGTVTEDQTLTANTAGISDADGLGAFSYQWLRNNVAVGGATASTYLLGDADVGAQMSVRVTYTDSQGTAEGPLTSAPTAAVANVNDAPIGGPTITGTVTEDQTLTANTAGISDADGLGAFSYQWLRNGVAVGGATASTYLLGDADVGAQMSVRVTYTDSQGTAEGPLTSAPTAAVANVNDAPIGGPTITGTVTEDQTLTANTAGISDADGLGAFSYQWLRNGVAVGGATASTYLLGDADVGAQMSVRVTYTDSQGTAEGPLTSAPTAAVANVNDAPIGGPTITGTVTEDQTLTANTAGISDADGLGAFSYQWLRNNVAVGGATASTYLLGDADVGAQMSVRVTYTDSQGTAEGPLTSAPTAAVANVNDAPIGGPTITGTVTEDQTLTANTAGISDADGLGAFSYQWLRNNVVVGGATASTYLLGDADVGAQMSVRVTYTDSQGTAEGPLTSAPTAAVANVNDAPIGGPTITGTVTEDQTLTANTAGISDADGLGAFSYQWLRNNVAVGGATASTYLLGDADVGAQMSVRVTYTDSQGTAEGPLTSAPTAAVANVNDAPIGGPTITGTVTEDQTLTANTAGISDADGLGAFSYQWLRNNVAVGGATASTYLLGDADVGAQMSVRVTYTDSQGTAEGPLTSAPTAAVANVNDAPIGGPTITGTVTEDQTLTANTAGISDADGLGAFSYQWLRNNVAVGGATASTYLLGDADVGAQMSVRVTYTDSQGTAEGPLTSAPTAAVANVNDAPIGGPTITGTVTEDQTLTANTAGISDADGLGAFSYQWLRNGVAVGGATASTYLLGDADVGAQMSVRVTYTDSQGTAEGPLTSAPTAAVANVNDAPIGGPTITGTVTEDQTLTANTAGISDADGLGAFSYQWLRNGVAVGGATASTYLLGDADVGAQMSVRVTYTDSQGTAEGPLTSAPTAAVANVNDAPIGGPTITGTVTEDQTLTANTAGISDADGLGAFSYQWLRNGVAVGGATASTYLLGDADVGAQMSVRVTYTDSQGTAEGPLTSAPTAAVANVNDAPIGGPTITGTVTEDQTLTANTAGISDADGLGAFSYQWLRNGVAVGGATASTYLLGDADVGAQMSVRVTYTDSQGTAEGPLTSAPTAAVANVNDAPLNSLPGAQSTSEDTVLIFSSGTGNQVSIADVDAGGSAVQVTLTANCGTVTLNGTTGLTFTTGTGTADATMTFTGTLTAINTALNGLAFAPTANFSGVASIQLVTNDQGNTGSGGGRSDTDTVLIAVDPAGGPSTTPVSPMMIPIQTSNWPGSPALPDSGAIPPGLRPVFLAGSTPLGPPMISFRAAPPPSGGLGHAQETLADPPQGDTDVSAPAVSLDDRGRPPDSTAALLPPSDSPSPLLDKAVEFLKPVGDAFLARLNQFATLLERAAAKDADAQRAIGWISVTSGLVLSAGLVIWLLRGGSLLVSLLASLPAWRRFDPLAIIDLNEDARRQSEQLTRIATAEESREVRGLRQLFEDDDHDDHEGQALPPGGPSRS